MRRNLLWLLLDVSWCLLHSTASLDVARVILASDRCVLVFIDLVHQLLGLEKHDKLLSRKVLNVTQET